jgi:hypothetical protein
MNTSEDPTFPSDQPEWRMVHGKWRRVPPAPPSPTPIVKPGVGEPLAVLLFLALALAFVLWVRR